MTGERFASRFLFPFTERDFSYDHYAAFLDGLPGDAVVPLREFAQGEGGIGLRHDVDSRLESAMRFARLEHDRGLRATYFVLHTAEYWDAPGLLPSLGRLQAMGHEVGIHHDLVTLEKLDGVDPGERLRADLERLRNAGIDVRGAAAHGSPWCGRLGYHNNYVFAGWDEPLEAFPDVSVRRKLRPADFGLEYEAYHLGEDAYFSDARFDGGGRWHPRAFRVEAGQRAIVLTHPCHWDSSTLAKTARLISRAKQRGARLTAPRR